MIHIQSIYDVTKDKMFYRRVEAQGTGMNSTANFHDGLFNGKMAEIPIGGLLTEGQCQKFFGTPICG